MRILFVYTLRSGLTPRHPIRSLAEIHFGLSHVAAYIKSQGHQTRLAVLVSDTPRQSFKALEAMISEFHPEVVAFTSVSTQYPFVQSTAQYVRSRWPDKQLIIGGVHSTLNPEEAAGGPFDAVCVGEGEFPLSEFITQLEAQRQPHGIPNLWLRGPKGTVEKNAPRAFLAELGQLPFPDRTIWHEWILPRPHTHHAVLPSRGCPYNCSYCSNHALRRIAPGRYVRRRPASNVLAEIRQLKQDYPETQDIYLQSETIALNRAWLKELTAQIKDFNQTLTQKITFTCNFRVARQVLSEDLFKSLAEANVRTMEIGLESGSERVRTQILRRHYSNDEFFEAVRLSRLHGMNVNVYNMIGLPEETPEDHAMTVEANHRVNPGRTLTNIFYPYPGTDLFQTCRAKGLVSDIKDPSLERVRASLDLPQFSKAQVQKAYEWFDYKVYRGHRSLPFRLRKVLRNKIGSRRWSNLAFTRLLPLWYALRSRRENRKMQAAVRLM